MPLLAGCFGERTSPVTVTPYLDVFPVEAGHGLTLPLLLQSTLTFRQSLGVRVERVPDGWNATPEASEVELLGMRGQALLVNLSGEGPAPGLHTLRVFVGDTGADVRVHVREPGGPHVGVPSRVRIAWTEIAENGTVLATSDAEILHSPHLDAVPAASEHKTLLLTGAPASPESSFCCQWEAFLDGRAVGEVVAKRDEGRVTMARVLEIEPAPAQG